MVHVSCPAASCWHFGWSHSERHLQVFIATPNSPMTASIVATVALDEQIPEHTRADMCLSCNHLFFKWPVSWWVLYFHKTQKKRQKLHMWIDVNGWHIGEHSQLETSLDWDQVDEVSQAQFHTAKRVFPECVARVPVSVWWPGGWGCVRSTLRLRPQPSATVCNRLQPSAWGPYGRACYGKFCKSGHFWRFQTSCSLVSRGMRGTSWHSDVFRNVWKSFCVAGPILLRRFQKMRCMFRGRRNTFGGDPISRGRPDRWLPGMDGDAAWWTQQLLLQVGGQARFGEASRLWTTCSCLASTLPKRAKLYNFSTMRCFVESWVVCVGYRRVFGKELKRQKNTTQKYKIWIAGFRK